MPHIYCNHLVDRTKFTLILYGVGVLCDANMFNLTSRAQSIYIEVYGSWYIKIKNKQKLLFPVFSC